MECSDGSGSGGRFSTIWLMCGGGAIGIMKAVADAAAFFGNGRAGQKRLHPAVVAVEGLPAVL